MSSRRTISNTFTVTTMDDPVSVQAQYSPDKTVVHTVWQAGDLYMRTRESDSSAWSSWHKIVGESGDETDFSFGISEYKTTANASTAPSDISSWSDAPLAVTTAKPYLWAKVQKKSWNASTQAYVVDNTRYIRLTGEDAHEINPNILLRTIFDYGIDFVKEKWMSNFNYVYIDQSSDTPVDGRKCLRIDASSASSEIDLYQNVLDCVKTGTWYTLSFNYWVTGYNHSIWNTFIWSGNDASGKHIIDDSAGCYIDGVFQSSIPVNGRVDWPCNWQGGRHSITFKTRSSFPTGSEVRILFRCPQGEQVAICMPKLEIGQVATAYMAHEDDLKGDKGKIGRFFYYAGAWNDFASTDSFLVNDAQAPYFYYNNNYWVFNPETNGTYTKQDMGTPSSSSSNWELMTSDFKYIITEAIFGSYAHFGSAIINGDWLLSTNGKIGITDYNNGSSISGTLIGDSSFSTIAYTLFDPQNPLGKDSTLKNGTTDVTIATSETTHTLGTVDLVSGTTYQITCKGKRNGSTAIFVRVRNNSYGTGQLIYYPSTTEGEYRAFFRVTTSATYTVEMYQPTTGGGGVTSMWSIDKVVFSPNYAVDLLTGAVIQYESYMQGFIKKSRTIINSSNINKYAYKSIFDDMVLDFAKCGNFIELQYQGSIYFALPMLSSYLAPKYTEDQKTQIRSFIGSNMIVYNKTGSNLTIVYKLLESSTYATTVGNNGFIELECHTDIDTNSKEVVFWEIVKQGTMV